MITMGIIKKWITDTLYASAEYQQFCTDTIGSTLNFYRSAPIDDNSNEILPLFTAYSQDYEMDDSSQEIWNETWVIPIAIAIVSNEDYVVDSSVKVWESTDKVELLAIKAKEIIKKELSCGINNTSINVLKTEVAISEIGEADDVQASMFITFGKPNGL